MAGTEIACGAMATRCPVLRYAKVLPALVWQNRRRRLEEHRNQGTIESYLLAISCPVLSYALAMK
eukprot:2488138-Rhodomonas_salina.3